MTTAGGPAHSSQYFAMVMSSAIPFICIAPSPTRAYAGRSGRANLAPIAYGTAQPIVASVPERVPRMLPRIRMWRAYQLVPEPESAVTMASGGSCGESSANTRSGLIGSAVTAPRASSTSHQRATFPSTVSRQDRSSLRTSSGSNASRVWRASPTRLTSNG